MPDNVLAARRFQDMLLVWYEQAQRDLPWRRTDDPYRILVSEVMLQQTQAARVERVFNAFCQRFPCAEALAAAPRADVLTAWRGLGYNRRAVMLHAAARVVVDEHGGHVPADLDALRRLPGVGEYTARAVLVFAFGRDVAPVDTNVARVLARAVVGRHVAPRELQQVADALVPCGQARDWSAALMDLGASFCAARAPRCGACPVAAGCAWGGRGGDPSARARSALPFRGSDRFHRGQLVDALRAGPVRRDALAAAAQLDDAVRAQRLADVLVRDGLAQWSGSVLHLPVDV